MSLPGAYDSDGAGVTGGPLSRTALPPLRGLTQPAVGLPPRLAPARPAGVVTVPRRGGY